jgi:hypothetical protein
MTKPAANHFIRVTPEIHHTARIASANLSALAGRAVPQAEAIAIAFAVSQAHPDEVRAALGVTA